MHIYVPHAEVETKHEDPVFFACEYFCLQTKTLQAQAVAYFDKIIQLPSS